MRETINIKRVLLLFRSLYNISRPSVESARRTFHITRKKEGSSPIPGVLSILDRDCEIEKVERGFVSEGCGPD